jgi:hypothetical protein
MGDLSNIEQTIKDFTEGLKQGAPVTPKKIGKTLAEKKAVPQGKPIPVNTASEPNEPILEKVAEDLLEKIDMSSFMASLEPGHSYAWVTNKVSKAFPEWENSVELQKIVSTAYNMFYKKEKQPKPVPIKTNHLKLKIAGKLVGDWDLDALGKQLGKIEITPPIYLKGGDIAEVVFPDGNTKTCTALNNDMLITWISITGNLKLEAIKPGESPSPDLNEAVLQEEIVAGAKLTKELSPTTQKIKAGVEKKLDFFEQLGNMVEILSETCGMKIDCDIKLSKTNGKYQAALLLPSWEPQEQINSLPKKLLDSKFAGSKLPASQELNIKLALDNETLAGIKAFLHAMMQQQENTTSLLTGFLEGVKSSGLFDPQMNHAPMVATGVNTGASGVGMYVGGVENSPEEGNILLKPAKKEITALPPSLVSGVVVKLAEAKQFTLELPNGKTKVFPQAKGILMHYHESWKGDQYLRLAEWGYNHPEESTKVFVNFNGSTDISLYDLVQGALQKATEESK